MAYLDDVIVLENSFDNHLLNLKAVLTRFRKHNLKLKPKKCCMFRKEIQFLGRIVSEDGVSVTPESIHCVAQWPVPRNRKDMESFLRYINYHREHIKDYAALASPFVRSHKVKGTFVWGEAQNQSFHSLRQAAILAFPKSDGLFILDTDASDHSLGAELSQVQNGKEVLISYASKTLSSTQRRYCVTRKELLAIVVFTIQFRFYLLGRPFIVRTDHHSLAWLLGFKNIEGQLARCIEELSQYNMTI